MPAETAAPAAAKTSVQKQGDSDDAFDELHDEVERSVESDPSLAPAGPSSLLVAARVLDEAEIQALLDGLSPLLDEVSGQLNCEADHESHAATTGCGGGNPQLSTLAWLFPHHAGAGRSARHQQGHHLRARRGTGKKTRPASRQAQGSLFGNHLGGETAG